MLRYIVIALLYFWAVANVNDSLLPLSLYAAVPLSFILSFWCTEKSLFEDKYFKLFTIFLLWICLTWFFAENITTATNHLKRLLGVFFLSGAICNLATDKRNIPLLYFLYVFVFVMASYYAQTHILSIQFDIGTDRLDDDRLNANVLANYTFYATFALYIMGEILQSKLSVRVFRILFLLMIPLSFVIAILTASRQVLIIQVPIIAFLLYYRYIKHSTTKRKCGFIILAMIALLLSIDTVSSTYDNSLLKKRTEYKVEDDGRYRVLEEAIDVGMAHPFFGVGPGNFYLFSTDHIFSHCSYTEVFANDGIIGLLIYLHIIGRFLYRQIKLYKKSNRQIYYSFIAFGVVFTLYNFFYVFYSDLCLMSFFLLVAKDSETYQDASYSLYGEKKESHLA